MPRPVEVRGVREMLGAGYRRAFAAALLGVVAVGAAGSSGPLTSGQAEPVPAPPSRGSATLTALDVVLQVRAASADPVVVSAPGAVDGLPPGAAVTVASALPPGLTGPPGTSGPLGVPDRVLAAYQGAEALLARRVPGCHATWWLLAGIGRIESHHAGGGRVDAHGRTRGEVLGPRLDGTLAGTMVVLDSDAGALDGDPAFDRAVGPMQFLPGTWRTTGADADGNRVADPHDVDDAALTAGLYLCRGGTDLADPAQLQAAVRRYNNSQEYVDAVLAWGTSYRDRAVPVPGAAGDIPAPVAPPAVPAPVVPPPVDPVPAPVPPPVPSPVPSPEPTPSQPSPDPTPDPTPAPTPEPDPAPAPDPGQPSLP